MDRARALGRHIADFWRRSVALLRRGVALLRRAAPFGAGMASALLAIWIFTLINPGQPPLSQSDVTNTVNQVIASMTPAPALSEQVYAAVSQSVVLVETTRAVAADDSLGSGVVIDDAGDIMTCLHVVANATAISVTFADGTRTTAQISTQDAANDIAVLSPGQVPANLTPATLGNPRSVRVGDPAYVIGNPFGLVGSETAGVISGLNRSFEPQGQGQTLHGLIQIDAAVNPGNSGGPLLNAHGQVVGIVAALINPDNQGAFVGVGLAVPIDVAGGAAGLPPY